MTLRRRQGCNKTRELLTIKIIKEIIGWSLMKVDLGFGGSVFGKGIIVIEMFGIEVRNHGDMRRMIHKFELVGRHFENEDGFGSNIGKGSENGTANIAEKESGAILVVQNFVN